MENNIKLVECLLCEKLESKLSLLNHIAEHIGYFRFQCKDCDFKTTYGHCIVEHEFETGHTTDTNVKSAYLERICNFIYSDCVYSNKHGLDAMYARKHLTTWKSANDDGLLNHDDQQLNKLKLQNKNSKTVSNLSFVLNNKISNKKNVNEKKSISNFSETPCTSGSLMSKEKENENKRQSNISNFSTTSSLNRTNEDDHITESEMFEFSRQVNRGRPTLTCAKCNINVVNEYCSHKKHVINYHIKDCLDVRERETFISKYIEICFPGSIAVNDFQCCICGHEMRSMSGRRFHVGREHLFFSIPCPKKPCKLSFFTVDKVTEHLKVLHTNQTLTEDEKRDYELSKRRYNNKLRVLVSKCFPCPLPITNVFNQELFTFDNNEKQRCSKIKNKRLRTELSLDSEQEGQESNLMLHNEILDTNLNSNKKQKKNDKIDLIFLDHDEDDIQMLTTKEFDQTPNYLKEKNVTKKQTVESVSSSSDSETEEQRRKRISNIIDEVNSDDVRKRIRNVYSLKSGRYTSIKSQEVIKDNENDLRKEQDVGELSSSSSSSLNSFLSSQKKISSTNFVAQRKKMTKASSETHPLNSDLTSNNVNFSESSKKQILFFNNKKIIKTKEEQDVDSFTAEIHSAVFTRLRRSKSCQTLADSLKSLNFNTKNNQNNKKKDALHFNNLKKNFCEKSNIYKKNFDCKSVFNQKVNNKEKNFKNCFNSLPETNNNYSNKKIISSLKEKSANSISKKKRSRSKRQKNCNSMTATYNINKRQLNYKRQNCGSLTTSFNNKIKPEKLSTCLSDSKYQYLASSSFLPLSKNMSSSFFTPINSTNYLTNKKSMYSNQFTSKKQKRHKSK